MCKPNRILGHEGVGEIVEIGTGVKDFKVGDKVIVPATTPFWSARECQQGFPQHSGGVLLGCTLGSIRDGMFADFTLINDADLNLALVPENMNLLSASMIGDMVTTGLHGSELAEVAFGDTVVVIGNGPVGLMAIAGAQLRGAGRIINIGGKFKCKEEVAEFYGATDFINFEDNDIQETINNLTEGKGADRCIIAASSHNVMQQAINAVRPGGYIANLANFSGIYQAEIPMDINGWAFGLAHKTIRGGLCPGGRSRMEYLINLVQYGRLDPSKLITHIHYGFNSIEKAFSLMCEKPANLIKPVVVCE